MKFIIITPTRNEGLYIKETLDSMINQIIKPFKWIIVNDGSDDDTETILKHYTQKCSFIKYISLPDRGFRLPAVGVISAFYEGYRMIKNHDYDIIAKFDADLKFPADMLLKIGRAFIDNEKLGITGGTRYEQLMHTSEYRKILLPMGFVGGPTKFYRRECFEEINGLISRAGWDGVDIIKANMKGWETGEIQTLKIIHLKPTGTAKGEGLKKAFEKYGDVSYYMGGYFLYFILRAIGRSFEHGKPHFAYYIFKGYFKSLFKKLPKESRDFSVYLKHVQIDNLKYWFKLLICRIDSKKNQDLLKNKFTNTY